MSLTAPKVKSWIRVNPHNEKDLKEVRALVPDEEVNGVLTTIEGRKWAKEPRCVVALFDSENVSVFSEDFFDSEILPTLGTEPEPQEPTRVEVAVFEYEAFKDREFRDWIQFVSGLDDQDSQLVYEMLEVKDRDLIMFRNGGFEIFTPQRPALAEATVAPVDEAQLRLQVLSLIASAPRYGNDDHKKSTVEYAADLYSWVRGS